MIPADNNPLSIWDGKRWIRIRSPLETDACITALLAQVQQLTDRLDRLDGGPPQ
jgi:hypothetical protein